MEKVRIGICDDSPVIAQALEQMVIAVWDMSEVECEVLTWTDGQLMLEQAETLQIAFLDITLSQIDGIELGRQIKAKNPKCEVVLTGDTTERFKEGFQIGALRFITKPFEKAEVEEALQAALPMYESYKPFAVYVKRRKLEFPMKQIQCVKAYDGYAQVYVKGVQYRRDNSLDELEQELDSRLFVRIHRKTIVNLYWIERGRDGEFWLLGEPLQVSRRKKKEFERKYMEYELKYHGGLAG